MAHARRRVAAEEAEMPMCLILPSLLFYSVLGAEKRRRRAQYARLEFD